MYSYQSKLDTLNLPSPTPTRACRDCVLCRAFGTGKKKDTCEQECSDFNLIVVKDKLPEPNDASYPVMHCKERDANDCWFYYTYAVNNNTQTEVHVLDKLGRPPGTGVWAWRDVSAPHHA